MPNTCHAHQDEEARAREVFIRELRRALRYLYEPDRLRLSSLVKLLPVDRRDAASSLQRVLVTAIEALKPSPSLSPHSTTWRTYQILLSHYVQQFQQPEIAAGLGLSLRQLRRYDSLAVQTLAEWLWGRYGLQDKAAAWLTQLSQPPDGAPAAVSDAPTRDEELEWLERSASKEAVSVPELTAYLLETATPLATRRGVHLEADVSDHVPQLLAPLIPVREALLALLTCAIEQVPGGQVRVTAAGCGDRVAIAVQPVAARPSTSLQQETDHEGIGVARELIGLAGGSFERHPGPHPDLPSCFRVTLPASPLVPVLVIDDNQDTLRLFERYLSGTRYAFFGTADPTQAVELALRTQPRIIVLDVMLPAVGGWELLARLREHPRLQGVPVVVCTILPQEQLAAALGAAAFLRKPVSRPALLKVLDEQLGQLSPTAD